MRIRPATGFDEQPALEVLRADGVAVGRQPSKARQARVLATLRSPSSLVLVADDDAVVGLLIAELARSDDGAGPVEPGLLHLSLLCVTPQRRRSGVGRALVRALLTRFDRVSTWVGDPALRALLEAEGFTATGRTRQVRERAAAHLVHERA